MSGAMKADAERLMLMLNELRGRQPGRCGAPSPSVPTAKAGQRRAFSPSSWNTRSLSVNSGAWPATTHGCLTLIAACLTLIVARHMQGRMIEQLLDVKGSFRESASQQAVTRSER